MIEFVSPGTRIDFVGRARLFAVLSAAIIALGIGAAFLRGVHFGIDFSGGSEIQVRFAPGVPADDATIRAALDGVVSAVSVVRFGEDNDYLIRFAAEQDSEAPAEEGSGEATETGASDALGEQADRIEAALAALGEVSLERVEFVGPRVGAELRRAGLTALAIAALSILVYIAFRFSVRFAPGAVVALLHDVSVTAGIWVMLGREFNLQVLAALLAIVGYSLNDTIIVYDRIRENMDVRTTSDLPEVLNRSVNQTLSRTILTSMTTLMAVLSLLILGGEVIRPFATAMTIGIVVGTYSSIYIAAPILLWLESRVKSA